MFQHVPKHHHHLHPKKHPRVRALIASSAVTILDLGIPRRDVSNCLAYQTVENMADKNVHKYYSI